ncbi:MAG TPA: N-acetylmuramoyl-L-alanine amidase [Elusimicrobiota bacterium]|nr:N-acetylmuramoyl-L-alanine amidase [Elusimicrobiota bacterium]
MDKYRRTFPVLAVTSLLGFSLSGLLLSEESPGAGGDPAAPVSISTVSLTMVHPSEGASLPALDASFVFGAADPTKLLKVNGQTVPIHSGGGYIAMIPLHPGDMAIRAELFDPIGDTRSAVVEYSPSPGQSLVRKISVGAPSSPPPVSPFTFEDVVSPGKDMILMPGDVFAVSARGSPGVSGYFHVEGIRGRYPLVEVSTVTAASRGSYRGCYVVQADDIIEDAVVKVSLLHPDEGRKTREARGRLTVWNPRTVRVLETVAEEVVVHAGPAPSPDNRGGYLLFLPKNIRLQAVGKIGDEWKVLLTDTRCGWVHEKDVQLLPKGIPPPKASLETVRVVPQSDSVLVRVGVTQKIPFEVVETPDMSEIYVDFMGGRSNTDWMHYSSTRSIVRSVRWNQPASDVYRLTVALEPGLCWGYDARYEGGVFVLELRMPPPLESFSSSPLEGLTVAVDAGHSADTGAVGPTGYAEKDANLAIAKALESQLKQEKARVIMIRDGDQNIVHRDRPRLAWQARADVLISVHNNGLPDGADPFQRNGYGVYYYHPHSLALAQAIHQSYGEILKLNDDGLHYGNLALARTMQMPAVLTESAYMIMPTEESLLRTEAFQKDCARSILKGLKKFMRKVRGRQAEWESSRAD